MGNIHVGQIKKPEAHLRTSAANTHSALSSSHDASPSLVQFHWLMGNRAFGRMVQAKLRISQPDDEYEREADRVAEMVMRMPEPMVQPKPT